MVLFFSAESVDVGGSARVRHDSSERAREEDKKKTWQHGNAEEEELNMNVMTLRSIFRILEMHLAINSFVGQVGKSLSFLIPSVFHSWVRSCFLSVFLSVFFLLLRDAETSSLYYLWNKCWGGLVAMSLPYSHTQTHAHTHTHTLMLPMPVLSCHLKESWSFASCRNKMRMAELRKLIKVKCFSRPCQLSPLPRPSC